MKEKRRKVPTEFAPETRFAVAPLPAAPFRDTQETELERLCGRLVKELLSEAGNPALHAPLRRAANEAAALAWTTPFPLLVLPELLREKAGVARRYTHKQAALLRRCSPMIGKAA